VETTPYEFTVGLMEVDPDLGRFLTDEELAELARIALVTRDVTGEIDVAELLQNEDAYGVLIHQGMVLRRIRVGQRATLRLLGPGEMLILGDSPRSALVAENDYTAIADTRLVMLDDRLMDAAQRWPRLFAALQSKMAEQNERLVVQLAICQLPRVTDRLLALMWLLAESWGRVTPSGVILPLALTHDALGGMIGARRPTVTLALGELSERGAIVRHDRGWLLLEGLSEPTDVAGPAEVPELLGLEPTAWSADEMRVKPNGVEQDHLTHQELLASVARLRSEHVVNRERVRERLAAAERSREMVSERRARSRRERR